MVVRKVSKSLPELELALRAIAMPVFANAHGDIFGGWLLSQMDLAGSAVAVRRAKGRVATVAVTAMSFQRPVFVGDEVSCYARILKVGRTSITVKVEAFARRGRSGKQIQVTEGVFTYVAVDFRIKAAAGVKCSRLPPLLPTLATSGPGCLVMVTWRQARFVRTTCWGSLLLALSDIPPAMMNVHFERNNGHDADAGQCLLMTQSGHGLSRQLLCTTPDTLVAIFTASMKDRASSNQMS